MFGLKCLWLVAVVCSLSTIICIYLYVCAFFQDDASSVLHCPAVCVTAAGGLALVPSCPGHLNFLPGKWRMEVLADFCQNNRQRLTVSIQMLCAN